MNAQQTSEIAWQTVDGLGWLRTSLLHTGFVLEPSVKYVAEHMDGYLVELFGNDRLVRAQEGL